MEDSLEDYMDEETARLLERYTEESAFGHFGFYDVDEYVALIDAYIWNADLVKAKEVLARAKTQYPQAVELKLKDAEICLETDLFEHALKLLAEVESVEPYLYDAYIVKGHTLICLRRYQEARESFRKAAEQGADEVDVAMGLAETEIEAGNLERAWTYTDQVIGTGNDTVETCNRFMDLAQKGDRLPEAMTKVRALLKADPYSLLYWKTLVELADAAACHEQALEACEFALAIAPDDLETLKNKFNLLETVDTEESQLDFYRKMEKIALESGDDMFLAAVWLRMAQEYEMDSMWEEAEGYYRRMLDVPSLRQYALFRLGVLADFGHDYKASKAYFEQALQTDSGQADLSNEARIYRGMARTFFNMGNEQDGFEYARKSVETDPENRFHLYSYLYDALNRNGQKDFLRHVEREMAREARPELVLAKAVFYFYTGRTEDSYGLFVSAFASDARMLKDVSRFFPEVLLDSPHVKEIWEAASPGLGEETRNWDDDEPFLYYGPDER